MSEPYGRHTLQRGSDRGVHVRSIPGRGVDWEHQMLSVNVNVRDTALTAGASKGCKLKTLTQWNAAKLNVTLSSEGAPDSKRGC